MIPVDKVREIISKHELLENKLSSDKIDKKNFAKIAGIEFWNWECAVIIK